MLQELDEILLECFSWKFYYLELEIIHAKTEILFQIM